MLGRRRDDGSQNLHHHRNRRRDETDGDCEFSAAERLQHKLSSKVALDNKDQESIGGICISRTMFWVVHRQRRRTMVSFELKHEKFGQPLMPPAFHKKRNITGG
ncbi:hypothetical protein MLD38_015026 [Melastoma candidum]|uniref:Uncharacterized protein n=1 Tax=Melastoma candidum TaxID=119954 RepID=A0ACB9RN69_9MYRT|nr:hypothetical protein MLD38_015026 [Melastoma candidum]